MTVSVLRLLQGDKRNPSRVLDFTQAGGKIRLAAGGFAPAPGKQTVLWSGQTLRSDGQQRLDSSRDNAEFTLTYNFLEAGSAAELDWLQREISRFFYEAGLYEEKRQGKPVWLEYCWPDGLESLPAPTFGQLRRYLRVLWGEPAWPANLHTWLRAGAIEGIVASLVCRPAADGLRQKALNVSGQIEMTPRGVLVTRATVNRCTNPGFGHQTWNTGWTASDAALLATQETRAGFTRSLDSAVHLRNQDEWMARQFYQTLTLTAEVYVVSCYVRRADGEEVTSADVVMWGQGAALGTTFEQIDNTEWYRAYAVFTAAASSSTHGVQIPVGREVYIDNVQIEIAGNYTCPTPYCAGYLIGCSWLGSAHASSSTRGSASLTYALTNELIGEYTISGWFAIEWANTQSENVHGIFSCYVDADNYIALVYDAFYERWDLSGKRNGSGVGGIWDRTLSSGLHHFALVQNISTKTIYIDGVPLMPSNTAMAMPNGGTLYLGCHESGPTIILDGELDGVRIWDRALSAGDIGNLYDAEKGVKDAYGIIGMPPFAWSKDGDGVLDACDDTSRDNYMVVGGIGGDMVEAIAEWQLDPKTTTPPDVYWIGRKAVEEPFDPASTFWLEFQGTADANSSGGQYEQHAFAGVGTYDFDVSVDEIKHLQGRVHFLARLYVSGNAVDVNPFYKFGTGPRIDGEVQTIPTNANFLLRAYPDWDMWVRWDHLREGDTPASLTLGLHVSDPTGGATVRCDFIQVLPYPNARIEIGSGISLAAGDTLHVIQDEAYMLASSGAEKYSPEFRGEPVNLVPNKYNYVWFLPGEEGQPYDVTDYATFVVYVTPRWVLPGGPVA
jgi:hypothetical protein